MAVAKDLFLVFLYHLFLLFIVDAKCPKSFDCGHLGHLEFPLSDHPNCGLLLVKDCNSSSPTLHTRDQGYIFLSNKSANQFVLFDPYLQKDLTEKTCYSFKNPSLPQSPFISFTLITPSITLFKCSNQTPDEDIHKRFQEFKPVDCSSETLPSYDHFTMYYKSDPDTEESGSIPSACSAIQLPIKNNQQSDDLFSLLSAEFILEWNVSEPCHKCYHGGGQCHTDKMNSFYCKTGVKRPKKILLVGGVTIISTSIVMFLFVWRKYNVPKLLGIQKASSNDRDIEVFLKINGNPAPRRYRYSEVKKMTNSFIENLGKGGYGSVYKGKLPDGHPVAVKILNESKGNGEEFMNEVASISRTSHVNIVTLLGFCFEGSKRALIYEFMPNGSLDKFIQNTPSSVVVGGLGWQKLFEIAVGIARGLEYLHQGCKMRILHFDIKPHNILLDKDFNPRISDFGLAKLCPNRSSIVSILVARGTIGYIAPEVFCRNFGEVSHKSDVYSYGMMVLEMAGGKKTIDTKNVDHSSQTYFPHYIYKQLLEMDAERDGNLDRIMNEDASQFAERKLIIVGLWCIQTDPNDRPSMTKVVEMLEGKLESLEVPPKPYFSSPPRPEPEFSISESI